MKYSPYIVCHALSSLNMTGRKPSVQQVTTVSCRPKYTASTKGRISAHAHSQKPAGGLYGDFTGNGIVDMNDLPDFLSFWPVYDCIETEYVDLNENCIVEFHEFAVLAENWLM